MRLARTRAPKDEYEVLKTLAAAGVAVAPFATSLEDIADVGLPAVVVARHESMPATRTMVAKYGDIVPALTYAAKAESFFMQRHVTGHEVACGVIMEGRRVLPLVPVEVIPRSLHESGAWHMAPAVQDAVQAVAKAAHTALGAKGHSCVRMVISGAVPFVTGVEFHPSLARTSLFMQSALLTGLTVHEVCESVDPNSLEPSA
jgi:D-alanine-D-alanine ligase-like ATP-grasp enzyme